MSISVSPHVYQAIAIKTAIRLYRDTGMKAGRLYTPKNMMAMASKITGREFKPRDYTGAINALECYLAPHKASNDNAKV